MRSAICATILMLALTTAPVAHAGQTYTYAAGPNLDTPIVGVAAATCDPIASVPEQDSLCVGGVLFEVTSPTTTIHIEDAVHGAPAASVCFTGDDNLCDGDDLAIGPGCAASITVSTGSLVHTTGSVFVFTLLVSDTLDVCGATAGTITIS